MSVSHSNMQSNLFNRTSNDIGHLPPRLPCLRERFQNSRMIRPEIAVNVFNPGLDKGLEERGTRGIHHLNRKIRKIRCPVLKLGMKLEMRLE